MTPNVLKRKLRHYRYCSTTDAAGVAAGDGLPKQHVAERAMQLRENLEEIFTLSSGLLKTNRPGDGVSGRWNCFQTETVINPLLRFLSRFVID
jgi:hypothetical protein